MELIKNIFFNTDKLQDNSTLKISYIGKLFQEHSENVFLYYTFDSNWENVKSIQMNSSELGFQAEIDIPTSTSLNFYFKDDTENFDNNNTENFNFPVEHQDLSLLVIDNNKSIRHLRKTYMMSKKIKLAIYKILVAIPKILTGNYFRKFDED